MTDQNSPVAQNSSRIPAAQSPVIVRLPGVMERTGLARSTIYHMLGQGEFPRPITLSQRAVGWISSEVDEWLLSRIQNSRANDHDLPSS
jgi:prophage regulatory protein